MRWIPIVLTLFIGMQTGSSQSVGYYVDGVAGNDANDGRSPSTAWQSLGKINATTFQPGDTLYLRSGVIWIGQLYPKGSGNSSMPIVLTSYGGSARPIIDGNGILSTGAVYLFNQEYWEINNLEVVNDAATEGDRRGVYIAASNFGIVHHIYLKNLYIHNVKGIVGDNDAQKRTGGIGIETVNDLTTPTRFDDFLIEACTIAYVDNTGLFTDNTVSGARTDYPQTGKWPARRFTNVRIRNNTIHHIAKNAMILRFLEQGVVECNVCYETALKTTGNTMFTASCDGTVFQFNEGYFNRSTGADGSMYDADLRSPNTIWQYSYSHDNAHGLFWTCTVQADSGIICRYNISRNDKGNIFCINYPVSSVYCYNNTVYIGSGVSPTIISERNVNSGTRKYYFYNNIIYNLSSSAAYDTVGTGYTRILDYNTFYGFHPPGEPNDPHKLTSNPLFVDPDGGGIGLTSVTGLKLQAGSPSINSGRTIAGNGGFDYWGNTVPAESGPDRGASEYSPSTGLHGQKSELPDQSLLIGGYPNPFNPDTNIMFQVPHAQHVELLVYNLWGQHIRTLKSGVQSPGYHTAVWDGTDQQGHPVSSGVYVVRFQTNEHSSAAKVVLLR